MVEVLTELIGKKFDYVLNVDNKEILFVSETGESYRLFHEQECCEDVYIEDVAGELSDLAVSEITMAECVTDSKQDVNQSQTYSFYKFATVKGFVTVRFYGTSNGYYSEKAKLVRFH